MTTMDARRDRFMQQTGCARFGFHADATGGEYIAPEDLDQSGSAVTIGRVNGHHTHDRQPQPLLSGRMILAFAAVYIIWGSTYLAIRYAVETLPPLLMAGSRFTLAGLILYAWARRGEAKPLRTHWRSTAIVGGLLLLGGNGLVTWAEQWVPSGMTALVLASTPVWIAMLEWLVYRGERPTTGVWIGLACGVMGIAIL